MGRKRLASLGRTTVVVAYSFTLTVIALVGMAILGVVGWAVGSDRPWWWLCRLWARGFLACCGVGVLDRHETERALAAVGDAGRPIVVLSNHQSYLDTLIWMSLSRAPLRFAVKASLYWQVPVLGLAMLATRQIRLSRHDAKGDLQRLKAAAGALARRRGVAVVYPEGTRSKTGELLPLKEGGLLLALDADALALPAAHWGALAVWPKTLGAISGGAVALELGASIDPRAECERRQLKRQQVRSVLTQQVAAELRTLIARARARIEASR